MKNESVKKSLEKSKKEKRKIVKQKICIKKTHDYNCYELCSRAVKKTKQNTRHSKTFFNYTLRICKYSCLCLEKQFFLAKKYISDNLITCMLGYIRSYHYETKEARTRRNEKK